MAIIDNVDVFEITECPKCRGEATLNSHDGKWAVFCCEEGCGFSTSDIYFKRVYMWGLKKHEWEWDREYSAFSARNRKWRLL